VYGERWAHKVRRLKRESPHGKRKGWAMRCIIVKSGDDCRQVSWGWMEGEGAPECGIAGSAAASWGALQHNAMNQLCRGGGWACIRHRTPCPWGGVMCACRTCQL
jgi:hypothetical protein